MRTPVPWVALLLVVAAVAPASALAVGPSAGPPDDATADATRIVGAAGPHFQTDGDGAGEPTTTVEISLRPDRSAFWRVETTYALDSGNETRAFRAIADRYESGEADVGPDATLFETLQRRATEATGREMAIGNVTYHSSVDESAGRGTLALTFRWNNFLRAGDNGTLVLDDVFELPTAEADRQRTWLSIFDDEQRIRIRPPEGYTVTSTSIPVQQRENAVVLADPSDFQGDGALRITYTSVGPGERLPVGVLAGAGILAAASIVAAAWVFRRRDGDAPPATPDDGSGPPGPDSPAVEGAAAAEGTADADGDGGADSSLLSDEERVEHLLERNDGRMKQATIVDEMGWSDAKVSQLLSAMAEEGRIDKLRLGRENLISLPDDGADTGDDEP
jgi:hypothetical protein